MKKSTKVIVGLVILIGLLTVTSIICPGTTPPGEGNPGDPGNGGTPGLMGILEIDEGFSFIRENGFSADCNFDLHSQIHNSL